MAAECNVLNWLDPKFSRAVAKFCDAHDAEYHEATERAKRGEPRGLWVPADWRWIKGAWTVSHPKAAFYGAFLLIGGWYLWYDVDRQVEKLWDKCAQRVHQLIN